MIKIRTLELTGAALDWAVAKCEGFDYFNHQNLAHITTSARSWQPSEKWSQGGPIIERELFKLFKNVGGTYTAQIKREILIPEEDRGTSLATHCYDWCNKAGPTPLIAAMRCYVASKLGEDVSIPEELIK